MLRKVVTGTLLILIALGGAIMFINMLEHAKSEPFEHPARGRSLFTSANPR